MCFFVTYRGDVFNKTKLWAYDAVRMTNGKYLRTTGDKEIKLLRVAPFHKNWPFKPIKIEIVQATISNDALFFIVFAHDNRYLLYF